MTLPPARTGSAPRPTLLLTGGAGVLGHALIDELAADHELVCLRRRNPVGDPRVREIAGDLLAPGLGLTPAERAELADRVDVVLHCAAETDWRRTPGEIRRANVSGTRALLAFAERAEAPFHYVSTAFVAAELRDRDRERFPGAAAYLESKRAAEQAVREAPVPGVILRPALLLGDSHTGRSSGTRGLVQALGSLVLGRIPVLPGDARTRVDLVPQDHVARAAAGLIRAGVTGGDYWLTAGPQALPLGEAVELCLDFAVAQGLVRPAPPRLVREEVAHRLLRPVPGGIPATLPTRARFHHRAELFLAFRDAPAFETSFGPPDCGPAVTRDGVRAALVRNLRTWAESRSRLLAASRTPIPAPVRVGAVRESAT
ncbi:SDR family oxidoreductase [Streptomyces subrutilus]|uniref:SDR family oxidoreductase n=1 Tax=Streptomyces subrutilus TaxID=36818 RepID=UPI00342FEB11